ncbi:MAG: hypothetical protein LIP04_14495, partial [Tannerellaceae bacterium]|nr:hypothetical protein [Tannerellaceae bacterium]
TPTSNPEFIIGHYADNHKIKGTYDLKKRKILINMKSKQPSNQRKEVTRESIETRRTLCA